MGNLASSKFDEMAEIGSFYIEFGDLQLLYDVIIVFFNITIVIFLIKKS